MPTDDRDASCCEYAMGRAAMKLIDRRHTVVELLQKRATNAGSDPMLLGEVVLLRATRCARPDPLWRARKELNPLDAVLEAAALPMSYTPIPAGGIEPPHDGATTRCLPTWLSRRNLVAEAGFEPAADGAYETPALPTELFRA